MIVQTAVRTGNVRVVREFDDERQALCRACRGTGWIREPRSAQMHACCICHTTGVVNLCRHCGDVIGYAHTCQGSIKERREQAVKKCQTVWTNAPERVTLDEARTRFGALYDVLGGEVVDVECLDSWLEEAYRSPDPILLYGTTVRTLRLDASVIVQTACEDLHELAADMIEGQAVEALQTFLDAWCARHARGVRTYVMDPGVAVEVPACTEEEEEEGGRAHPVGSEDV